MKIRNFGRKSIAILILIIPMLIGLLYFFVFAIDRYVSTAQVVVRQAHATSPATSTSSLLGSVNPVSREETLYLKEFISSVDMLRLLEKRLDWSNHYAGRIRDPLYWLSTSAPVEDRLVFFQKVVKAHYDEINGLLFVEVQAFEPGFAAESLKLIIEESEKFINEISHKMARDQVGFAQNELILARTNYQNFSNSLIDFQNKNSVLDAQVNAESRAKIIADLESTIAKERAGLKALAATLNSDTPQIRAQQNLINSLREQVSAEKRILVSAPDDRQMNVIAAGFRNLTLDAQIAEESYKNSVKLLDAARVDASKKIRSLVVVVSPNEADTPIYPRRMYDLITLFIASLLLYGVARFILATVEDHQD